MQIITEQQIKTFFLINQTESKNAKYQTHSEEINESHFRSIFKSISWRILGTVTTIIISYLITGETIKAFSIGGFEAVTKIFLFYFHERLWLKIPKT